MLALFGFLVIGILLFLVLTKKSSVHFALVVVPLVIGLIAGFGIGELGEFMGKGLSKIAQTGIMLTFAVLFFSILYDAGLFDPAIKGIIKYASGDPLKITVGTALIGMLAHLDGSGSSTFLITVSAMLPVYRALNMSPLTLTAVAALSAGTMNMTPWGGPTLRAATALNVNVVELFNPMIPVLLIGLVWVLAASYWLGLQERKRIGIIQNIPEIAATDEDAEAESLRRPKMLVPNLILVIVVIASLILGIVPMAASFVIGVPIALLLNYRDVDMQQKRIEAHARSAIYTSSVIFSAGIFTGILSGTGMITAMSETIASLIPASWGGGLPALLSILSMPMSIFFDADSMYFGVLPVLSGTAGSLGIEPMAIARAFMLGGHTTGFPITPLAGSAWLLVGLAGVDFGDHQKKAFPLALGTTVVMTVAALLMGLLQ